MKKTIIFCAVLCLAAGLTAVAAKKGDAPQAQQLETSDEVVFYPAGWKAMFRDINLGLNLCYKWTPMQDPMAPVRYGDMPAESLDWAAVLVYRDYLTDERGARSTVADHVAQKNCAALKCADSGVCPVHRDGRVPVNRLSKACPRTVKDWPEHGMYCGRYYKRETFGNSFLYYFDHYGPAPEEGSAQYAEITIIHSFKNKVYRARLISSASRIKKYIPHLEFIVKSMREKKKAPGY